MVAGVYAIHNMRNGHVYVGSSVNMTLRWRRHRCDLRHDRHHSIRLQAAWKKHGADAFEHITLELAEPASLFACEARWIAHFDSYRCGYNVKPTPNGFAPASAETRAKISAAHKGRRLTDEHRRRVSASSIGKKMSPEARANMSAAAKGRPKGPMSEETRSRISETRKRMFADGRLTKHGSACGESRERS